MSKRVNKRIQNKINNMGLSIKANVFIYMRIISCLILFIILLLSNSYGYIIAPLTTIIYYFLIEYVILDIGIKKHADELEGQALDFFPLFLIHLKGTRNVKKALYFTTSIIENDLSYAFFRMLKSVEIGKSMDEALDTLQSNIPSEYIKNIITGIKESNRVGTNIEEPISIQLDYIEEKKHQKIVNRMRIIPFKLFIISITFIFLLIIILLFFKTYLF